MVKRKGSLAPSCSRARKKAAKEGRKAEVDRDAWEVESTQRLDKLPQEVWEKILDELEENDLFPLALSCRYFRQKQKELVERRTQPGPESGEPRFDLISQFNRMRKSFAFANLLRELGCYDESEESPSFQD